MDTSNNQNTQMICPICYEQITLNGRKKLNSYDCPVCSHIVCEGCWEKIIRASSTCPVCREPVTMSFHDIDRETVEKECRANARQRYKRKLRQRDELETSRRLALSKQFKEATRSILAISRRRKQKILDLER